MNPAHPTADPSRAMTERLAYGVQCQFCHAHPTVGKTVRIIHTPSCVSRAAQRQRQQAAQVQPRKQWL